MAESRFLSREEILGGLPAKRANTLLFAIENRTGQLVARARAALTAYESERTVAERERAFLDALSTGREPPTRPTAMDLERYAPDWARLVPPDVDLRAALARLMSTKYRLPRELVPRLRAAVGIDRPEVQEAYQRLHGVPVASVYARRIGLLERLQWVRARAAERLETLPPFWTAFALTLTETVGAGILALPIALAALGAAAAVAFIVVLGAVNLITIVALVESITRSGGMRYGAGYLGRLVGDLLGRPGRLAMSIVLGVHGVLVLMILFLGFGSVLGGSTGVPTGVWAAVLLAVVLVIVGRGSLDATVASALVIGAIDIGILVTIAVLALAQTSGEHLAQAPAFTAGTPSGTLIGVAVAVVLSSYFGHTSAANAAKLVLRREPSGRSLLMGNLAAMTAAIVLYAAVVVAVIGAVGPDALIGHGGTSLEVLSASLGPLVGLLGVLYASLAMGLAAIHVSLGLGNQVVELLPAPVPPRAARSAHRQGSLLSSSSARSVARLAPAIVVLLALEWLLVAGLGTFTGLLSLAGALVVPLIGGVFPMLLVVASRRRGELVPGRVFGLVGARLVALCVGLFYLALVALHGLVIFESPIERAAAIAVVAGMIVVSVLAIARGALRPRAIVELAVDEAASDRGFFAVSAAGSPAPVRVTVESREGRSLEAATGEIGRFGELKSVAFAIPALAPELKIWLHRITPDRDSVALDVAVSLADGLAVDLDREGQAVVPLDDEPITLTIRSRGAASPA